jgi:Family of unknown function (DUF5681)
MADEKKNGYQVGYGKPPVTHRFQKGLSGNPRGRPRGARNFSTLLESALNEKVTIKEGDQRRKISKREAMVKQLANKAASGDHRSIQLLVALLQQLEARREASGAQAINFDAADEAVVEGILERFRATTKSSGGAENGGDKNEPNSGGL